MVLSMEELSVHGDMENAPLCTNTDICRYRYTILKPRTSQLLGHNAQHLPPQ